MTVDEKTPLKVFLATAHKPEAERPVQTEEESLRSRLADIEVGLKELTVDKRQLLPYEAESIVEAANKKRSVILEEKREIVSTLRKLDSSLLSKEKLHEMHLFVAEKGYPEQFDLAPLRTGSTLGPTFMISTFDNTSGVCQIVVELDRIKRRYRAYFSPKLPWAIDNILQDACLKMVRNIGSRGDVIQQTISAGFGGYAGSRTSEILAEVNKAKKLGIFDDILVIAEAPKWHVDEIVRVNDDPIIAGWVESTKQLFFITAYDMTPIEQYFRDQFATGVTLYKKKK